MYKHKLQHIESHCNNFTTCSAREKRQLHVLHVDYPIGQYIHVHVISSQITGNGYARVFSEVLLEYSSDTVRWFMYCHNSLNLKLHAQVIGLAFFNGQYICSGVD